MAGTERARLLAALEDLEEKELRRFKARLRDCPVEGGYDQVPRGRLEGADALALCDLLLGFYGSGYALQLAAQVLDAAHCRAQAQRLRVHRQEAEETLPRYTVSDLFSAPVLHDIQDIVMNRSAPQRPMPPSDPPPEEESSILSEAAGAQCQLPPISSLHISLPGQNDPYNEDSSASMNPKVFNGTSLKWVKFRGSTPAGAVHFRNDHAKRDEYPSCISDGDIGYYSPERGPYCFYPFGGKEEKSSDFWLLVNEQNQELLEWKSAVLGNAPSNAVSTCSGDRFFVGRSEHGIGKIDRKNRAFFVVIDGSERNYIFSDVLVIKKKKIRIENVIYMIAKATLRPLL